MTNFYLAKEEDPMRPNLWAEVQWTGWIYDGGIPLILTYTLVIVAASLAVWRWTGAQASPDLRMAAAVVLAYTVGGVAATFCFPIFHNQSGMDLWLLNGALFAAAGASSNLQSAPSAT
jgi:hypothetical protein